MSSPLAWLRGVRGTRAVACCLGVVLLVSLGGCSAPVDEAGSVSQRMPRTEPVHGGHLRVGYALEPTSLDAVLGRSGGDAYYWRQIYDQLVDADRDLNPRPSTSLATSWEISEDPDAITFRLREGVVFHDGTPFDAAAVKFNVDRILAPATKATPRASMTVIGMIGGAALTALFSAWLESILYGVSRHDPATITVLWHNVSYLYISN